MKKAYVKFAMKAFQQNLAFRADYIGGVLWTLITVFASVAIWTSIYGVKTEIEGVQFKMITTNFILGVGIANAFAVDEWTLAHKVWNGSIATDLLKPMSFMGYFFANSVGNVFFNLIMLFTPALIITGLLIGFLPPCSMAMFAVFLVSIALGFLILFNISFIVAITSFWVYDIFSFSTLKNVIISVLSGIMLPIWFMPEGLKNFIRFTPFDSIYSIPLSIYLGKIGANEIFLSLLKQVFWIALLFALGRLLWSKAVKKLVIEGG